MSLRTTSTTRPLTIIWCFSVLILILHQFKNLIHQGLISQDLLDRISDFPLLDLVATPTILTPLPTPAQQTHRFPQSLAQPPGYVLYSQQRLHLALLSQPQLCSL